MTWGSPSSPWEFRKGPTYNPDRTLSTIPHHRGRNTWGVRNLGDNRLHTATKARTCYCHWIHVSIGLRCLGVKLLHRTCPSVLPDTPRMRASIRSIIHSRLLQAHRYVVTEHSRPFGTRLASALGPKIWCHVSCYWLSLRPRWGDPWERAPEISS